MNSLYKFFRAIFFVFILTLFTPQFISAQGVVSRPTKQVPQNTPKQNTTSVKKSNVKLSLAAELDGKRRYFTQNEWKNLPVSEKVKYNKIGMVIDFPSEKFMISLFNNSNKDTYDPGADFQSVNESTLGQLPSLKQLSLIKENLDVIESALRTFGGYAFWPYPYWSNTGEEIVLDSSTSRSKKLEPGSGWYRLATNNVDKGFNFYEIPAPSDSIFDYVGKRSAETGLRVVRQKGKYGFINDNYDVVVPIKYDEVGSVRKGTSKNESIVWGDSKLMSVSLDGKWGYVNTKGEEITPIMFDYVETQSHKDDYPWVEKEEMFGNVNLAGEITVPIKYHEWLEFYNHKPAPTRQSVNGKRGYVDEKGNIIVPFKYDWAYDFGDNKVAVVGLNNKFGLIDLSGSIVEPLKYDNETSVPVPNSEGETALVRRDGKYGLIDKNGASITPFKYTGHKWTRRGKFYVMDLDGKELFLDTNGNEYASEKEYYDKTDPILAQQGDSDALARMIKKLINEKKYVEAQDLVTVLALAGDPEGYYYVGRYFFYGYEPVKKNYGVAFQRFKYAADQGHNDANYFMGWMCEHGQGTKKDIEKAIKYYKRSQGVHDSNDRIKNLLNN